MRLLVTGGAGFIGSAFVRTLLAAHRDVAVTVLDLLTYAGNRANLASVVEDERLTFIQGDIRDSALIAAVVPGHDVIVNFAAESHVDRSIADSRAFVDTNVGGTHVLLCAALRAGTGRFVQVSTDEVYGSIDAGSWDERSPLAPNSPYAATKAAADLLALSFARTHGLHVSVTRCGNNYGPWQHPEKMIPLFITNLLDGLPVPVYGTGRNVRHWIHVEDHCRAVQLVVEHGRPDTVYHVAGGQELTNVDVAERLIATCGADAGAIRHVADRPGHDLRYSLGGESLASLGFVPRTHVDDGFPATVDWYRRHRDWWEPLKRGNVPATVR